MRLLEIRVLSVLAVVALGAAVLIGTRSRAVSDRESRDFRTAIIANCQTENRLNAALTQVLLSAIVSLRERARLDGLPRANYERLAAVYQNQLNQLKPRVCKELIP